MNKTLHRIDSLICTPKEYTNHLRSHLRAIMALDHSRLGLENKFLENKSGPIFFAFDKLLYKILLTNLVACKPAFYTFYTHHIWGENSAMRRCFHHTDLGQNVVFLNFEIKIALIQYSGRLKHAWGFSETAKKISKITYTASCVWYGRHFEYSCKRCSWKTENKRHSDENCKRDYW